MWYLYCVVLTLQHVESLKYLLFCILESKVLVIGTVFCPDMKLENYFTGKVGLQEMFTKKLFVPKLNAAATYTFLDDMTIQRLVKCHLCTINY